MGARTRREQARDRLLRATQAASEEDAAKRTLGRIFAAVERRGGMDEDAAAELVEEETKRLREEKRNRSHVRSGKE